MGKKMGQGMPDHRVVGGGIGEKKNKRGKIVFFKL